MWCKWCHKSCILYIIRITIPYVCRIAFLVLKKGGICRPLVVVLFFHATWSHTWSSTAAFASFATASSITATSISFSASASFSAWTCCRWSCFWKFILCETIGIDKESSYNTSDKQYNSKNNVFHDNKKNIINKLIYSKNLLLLYYQGGCIIDWVVVENQNIFPFCLYISSGWFVIVVCNPQGIVYAQHIPVRHRPVSQHVTCSCVVIVCRLLFSWVFICISLWHHPCHGFHDNVDHNVFGDIRKFILKTSIMTT